MIRILLIAFFVVSMSVPFAYAQNAPAPAELFEEQSQQPEIIPEPEMPFIPKMPNETSRELPFESYDEIPQEALDDAQDFFHFCEQHPLLPTHYECQCWASRYLEERIKMGPNAGRTAVMLQINQECHNIPGAAGFAYNRCLKYGRLSYDGGMSPDEFCQCVGNNYAILMQRSQAFVMNMNSINSLMTSANLRCKTPAPGTPDVFERLDQDRN